MFTRLREKFYYFMRDRYGIDHLYYVILTTYSGIMILNLFLNSTLLYFLNFLLFIYMFYRVFSKKIRKRHMENLKYLELSKKPKKFFTLIKNRIRDRKTHVYKSCPACRSILRFPKIKGNHTVVCPRCDQRFDIKI